MPCSLSTEVNSLWRQFGSLAVIRSSLLHLLLISIILCGNRSSCRIEELKSASPSKYANFSTELRNESLAVTLKTLFRSESLRLQTTPSKVAIIPTSATPVEITSDGNFKESTQFLELFVKGNAPEKSASCEDAGEPASLPPAKQENDAEILVTTVQEQMQAATQQIPSSSIIEDSSVIGTVEAVPFVAPKNDTVSDPGEPSNQTSEPSDPSNQTSDQDNDMPSFDEWKRKKQAEQTEGDKSGSPSGSHPSPGMLGGTGINNGIPASATATAGKKPASLSQKRRRNYASFECGAKVAVANRESEGAGRILNEQMDEYMLNPCKANVWFIIELCDTIQATQLELANFELFSSLPKDFVVWSSDQYPTRDWTHLGTFQAPDQRTLHTFQLGQQGYGKFLKVELQSHYGKEHYCPLSVVRVFGTSMVDEFEDLESTGEAVSLSPTPDDDDKPMIPSSSLPDSSKDLFGSAKEVVINFMRKAAEALGREKAPSLDGSVVPDTNLSLQGQLELVNNTTVHSKLRGADDYKKCANHSLGELNRLALTCGFCISTSPSVLSNKCRFMWSVFNASGIHSLCMKANCQSDMLAKPNISIQIESKSIPDKNVVSPLLQDPTIVASESTIFASSGFTGTVVLDSSRESIEATTPSDNSSVASVLAKTDVLPNVAVVTNVDAISATGSSESSTTTLQSSQIEPSSSQAETTATPAVELLPETFTGTISNEELIQDIPQTIDEREGVRSEVIGIPVSSTQKESVFVRLNNRIRLLEVNLTLSSQYLQELSQRYRRQMEDMQRAFNRTVGALNQTALRAAERDRQQQANLSALQKQMEQLAVSVERLRTRNKTLYKEVLETHVFLIAVEAIVVITFLTLCWRRYRIPHRFGGSTTNLLESDEDYSSPANVLRTPLKRHHSVCDLLVAFNGTKKRRRPSETVSTAGTYSDLMIVEPAIPIYMDQPHKARKRHRNRKSKSNLLRSISNPNLSCQVNLLPPIAQLSPISSPAGVLFFPSDSERTNANCENCCPKEPTEAAASPPKVPFQNLTNPRLTKEESCKEHFSLRKLLKFGSKKGAI